MLPFEVSSYWHIPIGAQFSGNTLEILSLKLTAKEVSQEPQ